MQCLFIDNTYPSFFTIYMLFFILNLVSFSENQTVYLPCPFKKNTNFRFEFFYMMINLSKKITCA